MFWIPGGKRQRLCWVHQMALSAKCSVMKEGRGRYVYYLQQPDSNTADAY